MKLQVHRLHDDPHATLAEHAIDPVPARQYSPDLHAAIVHDQRRALLQAMSIAPHDRTASRKKPPLSFTTTILRFTLGRECTEANQASKSTVGGIRNLSEILH
ncbi:MAG TPA: hypothetical protein VGD80_37010 [Kofleriaceae bacterium]